MGLIRVDCDGYTEVNEHIEKLTRIYPSYKVFVFLTGSLLPETKQSWCPDCVKADPIVSESLSRIAEESHDVVVIKCHVGLRDYWKDTSNPFRSDTNFLATCIPTLLKFTESTKRLTKDEEFVSSETIAEFIRNS